MGIFDLVGMGLLDDDDDDELSFRKLSSMSRQGANVRPKTRASAAMRRAEERLAEAERKLNNHLDQGRGKPNPRSPFPDKIQEQLNADAIKRNEFMNKLVAQQHQMEAEQTIMRERTENLERKMVAQAAEKVKKAEREPSANLSTKDHEALASIVQSSLKMTDIFFDVSQEERQALVEKLNRICR